jgi:transcriptional regulator with XRE-family HTH domain
VRKVEFSVTSVRVSRGSLNLASVGEALRILRKGQGLSLTALADRIGWDKSRLSRYENNQVAVSVDDIDKIATALKVSPLVVTVQCLKHLYPALADPKAETSKLLDRVVAAAAKGERRRITKPKGN